MYHFLGMENMINQVTLIGRIVEKPILRSYENDVNVATLTLAVTRPFKNMDGNYETDFIKITLWNGVAQSTCDYTQKGDIVGVKGRVAMKDTEVSFADQSQIFKKKISILEIIGERVIFIHSNSKRSQSYKEAVGEMG